MATQQKVKWSVTVKAITAVVLIVLIIAEYYLVADLLYQQDIMTAFIAIVPILVLGYFALESPFCIELNNESVIIHKLMGKFNLPYSQIANINIYLPDKSEVRYLGSGGFFGFIGKFSNATIGSYQASVGDYSQAFLIKTKDNKHYVFSCENRELVINTIQKQIAS
ncbi:MAG: PH domain-containing protein [Dysgonamonadaceae bacterium]|jgi:hypothetical protein|nr:PH domain-containing protein [Dysgonamonadaceae bacterium]